MQINYLNYSLVLCIILKRILRNRLSQFLYSWIHPDIGLYIAQGSSKTSRDYAPKVSDSSNLAMKQFGFEKIKEGFDYVVMGHFHKPQKIKVPGSIEEKYYITLGDWIENNSYGVYINGV